jgi:NAD(P)-dependent dehydrogenase (short-subunit alcohol dehydrogenase family)
MSHLIVIGGTKGLGRAFVSSLNAGEYNAVTVLARSTPEAASQSHARFIAADAMDRESLLAGLEQAVTQSGAISAMALFQQYRGSTAPWDSKLAITLTASKLALDFFAQHAATTGDKAAVLLTSNASRLACEEQDEGYHASKSGLLGLCRYYANKLGAQGIRINCVSPGTVLKEESKQHFLRDTEMHELFQHIIPLRRMGTADEVASVIKFLLSAQASFVTGQELVVDGGASLQSQESLGRAWLRRRRTNGIPTTSTKPS